MSERPALSEIQSPPRSSVRGAQLTLLLLLSILVLALAPLFGAVSVPLGDIVRGTLDDTARRVLFDIRVPRVFIAFIAGGALGVGGLIFQTIFRNVLATPYTLGVSSGASLGAAIYFKIGLAFSLLGVPGSAWIALLGAAVTVAFIDRTARKGESTTTLLLAGVVLSFFAASLISLLEYLSSFNAVFQLSRWLMGGFESVSLSSVVPVLPLIVLGLSAAFFHAADLNILALGDELSVSRGVDAPRVRRRLLIAVSLMIGAVVSFAGPIGFVGVVVPHALRLILGHDNRRLVPCSLLASGAFLVICDTVARTIAAPYEIPVGVITALLGGPYFLRLLLTKRA